MARKTKVNESAGLETADVKKVPTLGGVQGTSTNESIASGDGAGKTVKAKYWAGIIYPESMPDNWRDVIEACHVPCVVSPLHDKDVNPDGSQKKPHYHVMFCYSNTTTGTSASHILAQLGSSLHAERVMSAVGNYRYLTHRDNPEKAQYSESDIVTLNGFSYTDNIGQRTATEQLEICERLMDIVLADVCPPNYLALIEYLRMMDMGTELEYTMTHTYFVKELLASKRAYHTDVTEWQMRHGTPKDFTADKHDDTDGTDVSDRG